MKHQKKKNNYVTYRVKIMSWPMNILFDTILYAYKINNFEIVTQTIL